MLPTGGRSASGQIHRVSSLFSPPRLGRWRKLAPDDLELKDLGAGASSGLGLGREYGVSFNDPLVSVVHIEASGIQLLNDGLGDRRLADSEARGEIDELDECFDFGFQRDSRGGWARLVLNVGGWGCSWGHDDELEDPGM